MKLHFKTILTVNILMLCLSSSMIASGYAFNNVINKVAGITLTIAWSLILYKNIKNYINDEKQEILTDIEEQKADKPKDVPSSQSIYNQLNGLTKDEILWLHEHAENQKKGLIEINTSRRENYLGIINMFSESKGLENLAIDAKQELELWDEFYLEQSSMIARILPKLELLKDAVS